MNPTLKTNCGCCSDDPVKQTSLKTSNLYEFVVSKMTLHSPKQSTLFLPQHSADKGIDGIEGDSPANLVLTKNTPDEREWWIAKFDGIFYVEKVRIQNREALLDRLQGAKVFISDKLCGTLPAALSSSYQWINVKCNTRLAGDRVKIAAPAKG